MRKPTCWVHVGFYGFHFGGPGEDRLLGGSRTFVLERHPLPSNPFTLKPLYPQTLCKLHQAWGINISFLRPET